MSLMSGSSSTTKIISFAGRLDTNYLFVLQ
jgi:hypothetical protein